MTDNEIAITLCQEWLGVVVAPGTHPMATLSKVAKDRGMTLTSVVLLEELVPALQKNGPLKHLTINQIVECLGRALSYH